MIQSFNIRVYGILVQDDAILVTDELIRGMQITKFPGGGLELGEGTIDCLQREFLEEMGLQVKIVNHIYTTDFFQQSAFNPAHQIISIYYRVEALEPIKVAIKQKPFDFDEAQMEVYNQRQETETFRFIPMASFSADDLTLPIDKLVAGRLVQTYRRMY